MKMISLKTCLVLIVLSILLAVMFVILQNFKDINRQSICLDEQNHLVLQSTCECKKWQKIVVVENSSCSMNYSVFSIDTRDNQTKLLYNLERFNLESAKFTCDLFAEFRLGKDQNVISYSLYGNNSRYYKKIGSIIKQAKQFYPNWSIRIYSDANLNESIRCKYECFPEDNVDFCIVNSLPINPNKNIFHDASYINPTMWRFLPMGDSFVKFMISRDSDSYIIQRELDAVNEWLDSGKLAHIMKDHPFHGDLILAGMWGLRLDIHKDLIDKWWTILINPKIAKIFNPYKIKPRESDQIWLRKVMWHQMKEHTLVHDSFNCRRIVGDKPWPTQRVGNCYVGSDVECDENGRIEENFTCPIKCRPKEHPDWISC